LPLPPEDPPPGVPEWVVTYGDMMSLLLTFFIMLVSMSELKSDTGSVRAMLDALNERFGPDDGRAGAPGRAAVTTSTFTKPGSSGGRSEGGTKTGGQDAAGAAGAHLTVERIRDGSVITLGGPTMFGPHDATLGDELRRNLDILVTLLDAQPNRLVIRGHASRDELRGDAADASAEADVDPYDLSFARARNVATYLAEHGIDPARMLVSAVGDTEPRIVTADDEQRRVNRRVDVFVIDAYTTPPEPSAEDAL
jgi:chemotaxis protein MotB